MNRLCLQDRENVGSRGGSQERLTPQAREALEEEMKAGRIARFRDAQAYFAEHWASLTPSPASAASSNDIKSSVKLAAEGIARASEEEQKAFKKLWGEAQRASG